jgi:hypothetical protein
VDQARVIGHKHESDEAQAEVDLDKEEIVANRRNRRAQGERRVLAPTIGAASTPSVKDILRVGKRRKGTARTPEHFARWTTNQRARKFLSTQPVTVLEPDLGKQVHLLKAAGYTTAHDVAREVNYTKLSGIKGVGPAFLQKTHDYLISIGFTVQWRP